MSANEPQPIGSSTIATDLSQKNAAYLPPSELALKYAKGLHQHFPAVPHASATYEKGGKNPHLIKSIESFYVRPRWLFTRIETEGGVVGWGEGTLEGHTEAVQGSLQDIARRLVGWDAMNIEDIYTFLTRLRFYRGGPVLMSAISGYGGYCPVIDPGYPNEIKDLYNKTSIPIALGERLFTREDFRPYFELGCIDIAQPDIAHSGGISETKKIATMAEAYDIGVAPHCPLGPLAFAACLQIGFSTPNFVVCEMSWKMHYNTGGFDLFTYMKNPEVFNVVNGAIPLLTGPGLGIELNEDMIRAEAETVIREGIPPWQNPIFRGDDGAVREW